MEHQRDLQDHSCMADNYVKRPEDDLQTIEKQSLNIITSVWTTILGAQTMSYLIRIGHGQSEAFARLVIVNPGKGEKSHASVTC